MEGELYNSELIQKIRYGLAPAGQLREYCRRVARRKFPSKCVNGHEGCAIIDGGPCVIDCSLAAAEMEEVKSRPPEVKTKDPEVKTRGSSIFL